MTAIRLNGNDHEVASGTNIADIVTLLTSSDAGCAVAVNDEVVPRHEWSDRQVVAGDRVEVLTAVQGG